MHRPDKLNEDDFASLSETTQKLNDLKVELASGFLLDCQENAVKTEIEILKNTPSIPKT